MRKLLIFSILLAITSTICSQAPFTKLLRTPDDNFDYIWEADFCQLQDSSFIVIGVYRASAVDRSPMIVHLSSSGELIDTFVVKDPLSNVFSVNNVLASTDSGFVITGVAKDALSMLPIVFCVKFNAAGDTIWNRSYRDTNFINPMVSGFINASDGGFIILVNDNIVDTNNNSINIIKIGTDGNLQSFRRLNTDFNSLLQARSIIETSPNKYYVVGDCFDAHGSFLISLSSLDTINYFKIYPGIYLPDIVVDDSFIYISCIVSSSMLAILKLDLEANFVSLKSWQGIYDGAIGTSIILNVNTFIVYYKYSLLSYYTPVGNGAYVMDKTVDTVKVFSDGDFRDCYVCLDNMLAFIQAGPFYPVRHSNIYSDIRSYQFTLQKADSLLVNSPCNSWKSVWIDTNAVMSISVLNRTVRLDTLGWQFSYALQKDVLHIITENKCIYEFFGAVPDGVSYTQISTFPNPSNGIFNLSNEGEWLSSAIFIVYNAVGKEQVKYTMDIAETVNLNLSFLQSGIYYYQIISNNNILKQDKFVVIK